MLLIENELFKIYASEEYHDYAEELIETITYKAKKMFDFYGIDGYSQVSIIIDDTQEEYNKNINYEENNIHICYDADSLKEKLPIEDIMYEYSHILYNKIVPNNQDKVAWLDEGLAQVLTNSYREINGDYEKFKEFFLSRIVARKYKIPYITDLKFHGEGIGKFDSNRYDGKAFAYMLVRYLFTKGYDINKIIRDKEEIKKIESTLISDMINYYGFYFNLRHANININYVKTPSDLMDYMNYAIQYGWEGIDNIIRVGTLKGVHSYYRINTVEQIIKNGVGTCLEQAKLEKYIFDKLGLNSHMFCSRTYEDGIKNGKVDMHCMVVYEQDNKWYLFEHADPDNRGIKEFTSYEMLLEDILNSLDNNSLFTEIYEIPEGITMDEFNEYVDQFVPLIKEDGLIKLDDKCTKMI